MSEIKVEFNNEIGYDDVRAKEWIYRALTGLTALEQNVLALFYSKELTVNEIADRVNLSPAGVRNTLAGARNTIRLQLRKQENATGLTLPDAIPAAVLTGIINERMLPLLMEIRHDEELRVQAEKLRLEEEKRIEEEKLREDAEKLEAERETAMAQFAPDLEAAAASADPGPESPEPFVIQGSPYEQDRRRSVLGAMAAGTEVPESVPQPAAQAAAVRQEAAAVQAELPGRGLFSDDGDEEGGSGEGGTGGGRKRRLWIPLAIILLALLVILGILVSKLLGGGRGSDGSGGTGGSSQGGGSGSGTVELADPKPDGGSGEDDELAALRAQVAAAYLEVLYDQEDGILASAQFDGSFDDRISRPCALADIDGDGIEELFILTVSAPGMEGSELHIYGYMDGEAKEISFEHQGWSGFAHYEVAGGGNFAVYTGKDPGTLYIYECMVDDGISYSLVKYSYRGGTEMNTVTTLTNWFWDHGDPNTRVDEYKENGTEIPASEGGDKFSAGFSDFDTGVLFSTARGTAEVSLWKYFDTDGAEAMSYVEILELLASFI